ncbi:DNA repair exonuclease [Corynebacterium phocae]|uniref:Nuclease SbcCD subunit D n=1 Tax=Corynebacterium phocae TaxID=161895 RepID=A0A1L7D451_9CORY|nr:exonuclease SbcCD subunit D [Corynebacterium phocae]APT92791.1 DNA repair exonuclease [Corynebacterium phocae]KAA8723105.1 exonuclease SbcCD subunit D [Corynebacterium phocae]
MSKSLTFIHTSDLQLGMKRWFLEGEAQARFEEARIESIAAVGALAEETGADFIVVAGDVFEHNALSRKTVSRAKEAFQALPVPVYLLPGNHDPLTAGSILEKMAGGHVHVITDATPIAVSPGVEVVGAPYVTKRATHDIVAAALRELEPTEDIRVMVAHGQVSSRSSEKPLDLIDLPTVEQALRDGVIDYLALGDTHSTVCLGNTGAVWFSGAPETTDFHELDGDKGENDSGNALVVTITKEDGRATVEVERRVVGRWTFDSIHAHLNSEEDVDTFLERLAKYPDKSRTVIKYGLTGTISLSSQRKLEDGLESWKETFAALNPRERTTELVLEPEPEELKTLGLRGYVHSALEELVEDMEHDPVARDAANLLFRLSGKGA